MTQHWLSARRLFVIAPHPDDETIAAWGLIRAFVGRRAAVRIVVVSDGGASHPESTRWPTPRLIAERRRETLRAMRALALPPLAVTFLSLPDGALEEHRSIVDRAVAWALRGLGQGDLIVAPLGDDDHPDHRSVAHALAALPRHGELRLGYAIWPEGRRQRRSSFSCHLGLNGLAAKRQALRGYRTQSGWITDARAGFTMTARHLRHFAQPFERFSKL